MRKLCLMVGLAFSLFTGIAFAMGTIPYGESIVMTQPADLSPSISESPVPSVTLASSLNERICTKPQEFYCTLVLPSLTVEALDKFGHFDTDDPKVA